MGGGPTWPADTKKFTQFAVAGGSGLVGRAVVAGLVGAGAEVVVLSRSKDTKVDGAVTKAVDFESVESVQKALKGVEVVVSTLGGDALGHQPVLARAAKAAGVQLFLPSEFGTPSRLFKPGSPFYAKREFAESLKTLGLPSLLFSPGLFPETTFAPDFFGLDFKAGRANIVGPGEQPFSFTTVEDTGKFLGPLLASLPPSELATLGEIVIEGSRASLNQSVAYFNEGHPGHEVDVTTTSFAEAEEELKQRSGLDYAYRWLFILWARGGADVTRGGTFATSNHLVPGWKATSVEDYLTNL